MTFVDGVDFTETMTTGEVAKLFAVDPRAVSRWAEEGRLSVFRTPGGHRRYSRPEVYKLLREGAMRRADLPLRGPGS